MTLEMLYVTCDMWHEIFCVVWSFWTNNLKATHNCFNPLPLPLIYLFPTFMRLSYQFSWKLTKMSHENWPLSLMIIDLRFSWEFISNFSWEFTSNSHDSWVTFAQVPVKRNGRQAQEPRPEPHVRPHRREPPHARRGDELPVCRGQGTGMAGFGEHFCFFFVWPCCRSPDFIKSNRNLSTGKADLPF